MREHRRILGQAPRKTLLRADPQDVEEFLQTPERRLRINGIRLCSPASVRDPVAILAHLIYFLDKPCVASLEDFKYPIKAAVLYLLNGALHDLDDDRVAQPSHLILDFGEHLIPDDGLEHGKEDQDGEVVEMFQAEHRTRDDRSGLEALQSIVSAERPIPGKLVPMFPAQSAEQLKLVPRRNIPVPGIT
jgi:hypothetical protein